MRSFRRFVACAAALAACQPETRRVLLLDLNLSDPAALQSTAEPWDAAGYTVEYRRGFPHLTRQDLHRYRVVLLLGGREPEAPSDGLDQGDLALLTQWVPQGGVLVFGYAGDGEGYQDRWVMNRWLASMGAGVTIGDWALHDRARAAGMVTPVASGPLSVSGTDPFPLGRSHVLLVQHAVQVLARASPGAFVDPPGQPPAPRPDAAVIAAARVQRGLVVIASRHALATLGPEYRAGAGPAAPQLPPDPAGTQRTRRFLVALARWTRRPAEWVRLRTTRERAPLAVIGAPRPVAARPPQPEPPASAAVVRLPAAAPPDSAARAHGVPGWIRRQGMRGWSAAPGARIVYATTLDSLIGFLEAGAFNLLWSSAEPTAAESLAAGSARRRDQPPRSNLRPLAERLQTTSVLWIPGLEQRSFIPPADGSERGLGGDTVAAWCTLDSRYWNEVLTPAYVALGRLAASHSELVAGVGLDLDPVPGGVGRGMGAGFCDSTWVTGLRGLQRDSAWTNRLAALPVTARYDSLLAGGDLEAYYAVLEREVAARATRLRLAVRRLRPDVLFAFRATTPPTDWFGVGLLRGFSTPDLPLLVWTRESRAGVVLAQRRTEAGGALNLVHAVGAVAGDIRPGQWAGARLPALLFRENDGFWFAADGAGLPADSVARRIRRLAK